MKVRVLLLGCIFISTFLHAQNVTGIWRGYFNSGYGYLKQQYKYEVQIDQLGNKTLQKGVQGVTYSYHSTVFYGKANLQGIYDSKNKSITLKETKLVELKISQNSEPCLMTCYLDYRKEGKTEILEGDFTSVNANSKADCGSGYVYLERVAESDFHKEDFLLKKRSPAPPIAKTNPPVSKNHPPATSQKKTTVSPPIVKKSNPVVPKNSPRSSDKISQQKKSEPELNKDTIAKFQPKAVPPITPPEQKELTEKSVPVPDVIRERANPLVKTITTNSPQILIQLFDNGEIDGDTITVYHNNEVIAYKKGLAKNPVTINLNADINNTHHEFVMVANNLGSIPPNTALMVINTGGKRYELFISSDEKKNARVVIEYKMPGKESK